MNITFLIGNGFDLNLGLKTGYKHFLEKYTEESNDDSDLIKEFKNNIKKDIETWSSAELAFGLYTSDFKKGDYDSFFECYDDFCENLAAYLKEQESRLNYSVVQENIGTFFGRAIKNIGKGLTTRQIQELQKFINPITEGITYNFISFNYTSTIDMCWRNIPKNVIGQRSVGNRTFQDNKGRVLHIHGDVSKNMVFGLNDESQMKNPELFEGCHDEDIGTIIKSKTYVLNQELTEEETQKVLDSSDLVYIYGMSIGATDALWWDRIIQLMAKRPNMRIIIHSYATLKDSVLSRIYRRYEREKKEEFLSYSKLAADKYDNIFSRIHITRENIFEDIQDLVESGLNKMNDPEVLEKSPVTA